MNYIHLGIIHYFGIKTDLDVIHPLAPLNPTKFNWGQSNINFCRLKVNLTNEVGIQTVKVIDTNSDIIFEFEILTKSNAH